MDSNKIRRKFGDDYEATDNLYTMGIDRRFTEYIARRYENKLVLESCTGGGFTTISLARAARHVFTYEIDPLHQSIAQKNIAIAGLEEKVTLILGDVLDSETVDQSVEYDAALLDPDWAVSGDNHIFKFKNSNTRPPADILLNYISELTPNIALILPPFIDISELNSLPEHELQSLYIGDEHVLYCVYFGDLIVTTGATDCRA
jgi:hypothetical protein